MLSAERTITLLDYQQHRLNPPRPTMAGKGEGTSLVTNTNYQLNGYNIRCRGRTGRSSTRRRGNHRNGTEFRRDRYQALIRPPIQGILCGATPADVRFETAELLTTLQRQARLGKTTTETSTVRRHTLRRKHMQLSHNPRFQHLWK